VRSTPCMKSQDDEVIETAGDPKSRRRLWMRDTRRDLLVMPGEVCHIQMGRVSWFMVRKCGARRQWSTAKVKVMRVRAEGLGAVKDRCWDWTEGQGGG